MINALCCRLLIVIGLCGYAVSARAQAPTGYLSVSSDPSAQPVYVDSVLIGQTPITSHALSAGRHRIRIEHPNRSDWYARDYQGDIVIEANETLTVDVPFSGTLHILSEPFNAEVYIMEGMGDTEYFAGTTPLRLPNLDRGLYRIAVRLPGYQDAVEQVVVTDTSRTLSVELTAIGPVRLNDPGFVPKKSTGRLHRILGYTTLGLGAVFSGLALHSNRQADRAYGRYLNTADPAALERAFQSAARHDERTSKYVIGAQLNFAATFYFFITHVFKNEKR